MSKAYPCARQRRLQLPLAVVPLLERHQVLELLRDLLDAVAVARPDDPIAYCIDFLRASKTPKFRPRLVMVTPEQSAHSFVDVAALIATLAELELVTREDLAAMAGQGDGPAENEDRQPSRCWSCARDLSSAAARRLLGAETAAAGWVLAEAPTTRPEAEALRRAGVLPTHVVRLQELLCPETAVQSRSSAHLAPSLTTRDRPAPSLPTEWAAAHSRGLCLRAPRHAAAHRHGPMLDEPRHNLEATLAMYRHTPIIKVETVHGGDHEYMAATALSRAHAYRRPHGMAWRPRIVLFGPLSAGLQWYQERLCYRFGLCPIDFASLLKQEGHPRHARWSLPAAAAAAVVLRRLSQPDCLPHGWVLTGFPRDASDLEQLDRSACPPNRLFLFNNSAEWCLRHAAGGAFWKEHSFRLETLATLLARARRHDNPRVRYDAWYPRRLAELQRLCGAAALQVDGERGRARVFRQLEAALAQAAPPAVTTSTHRPTEQCVLRSASNTLTSLPNVQSMQWN